MRDTGSTGLATVPDQIKMESEMIFGRDDSFHKGVGFIGTDAFRQEVIMNAY